MKAATKLDKRNTARLKKLNDDVMSRDCDVIVIFPSYGQFVAIQKPDSECIVSKTYIFIDSNLSSYSRTKNGTKTELKNE